MKVLILDNYDSFTFNLYHYLEPLVTELVVVRNDEVKLDEVASFDGLVLSPGPGLPAEAGRMMELIERFHDRIPILGVCLGHQALAEFFGAKLLNLPEVLHGRPTECEVISEDLLFEGCGERFLIGHYHSWVVAEEGLPEVLKVSSRNSNGHIMSLRHKELEIRGVQFHPESILTPMGKKMIQNWVASLQSN